MTIPRGGSVERAVRAELRRLKASVVSDGLAALAVSLAWQVDEAEQAKDAAAAAAQLRAVLGDLRRAGGAKPVRTRIDSLRSDELAARRRSAG